MALVTMRELLEDARQRRYAVGMFDASDYHLAKSIVSAAEEMNAPVMLATAEVLLAYEELEYLAESFIYLAKKSRVPVCVFFDHGISYENTIKSIKLGFNGVMYDGALLPFEENILMTNEVKKVADVFGCSVEAEIGHVGGGENDEKKGGQSFFTRPELAELFVERTGVDALAVAIGNIHGLSVKPDKLHIDLLQEIAERTCTPLVLHGGSGLPESEIKEAIAGGICKLNIWSELIEAFMLGACSETARKLPYCDWVAENTKAVAGVVREKIMLCGSENKA
jgi:fructose-bisphosphate aldolase class II